MIAGLDRKKNVHRHSRILYLKIHNHGLYLIKKLYVHYLRSKETDLDKETFYQT